MHKYSSNTCAELVYPRPSSCSFLAFDRVSTEYSVARVQHEELGDCKIQGERDGIHVKCKGF